ncbi:hypothetical protein QYE76_069218 [Lolium multiflorum]|uniref:Retrotransposon gag domain-containing protein n=1 Tax=Lolium multiflorum TaxID=4521 RepID=A0AAD8SGZ4_LOLMU|nr:hypothetical protein QYE76_069218 [Lolium multiflorum]
MVSSPSTLCARLRAPGSKPRVRRKPQTFRAAAIARPRSGGQSLPSARCRREVPGRLSIDTAAISTAIFITAAAPMRRSSSPSRLGLYRENLLLFYKPLALGGPTPSQEKEGEVDIKLSGAVAGTESYTTGISSLVNHAPVLDSISRRLLLLNAGRRLLLNAGRHARRRDSSAAALVGAIRRPRPDPNPQTRRQRHPPPLSAARRLPRSPSAARRLPSIAMDEVRKKLFSISLSGKAAHWYKLLDNGDSLEWNDIVPRFYSKFYPPSEIHKDRNRIYNFWPHDGESIAQAWGRLKSLMLKCPIHELPGNVIIDNFYARLSFQDKTLLDTSCSGSFTRNKEEFKRDLLNRIQENTEGWENDKDRESGINYDYKCIEAFMDTDKFRNMSATYGLDSQVAANLYKAFASHYELPKKNFDKYHEPYKDKIDSSINKCVVVETADHVIPEAYIEKTPFPAKMKEYSVINSAVHKSEKKPIEPEEQIKVEPAVAIVKDLVTENVEDGHIIFCEDASNIVSHPNKSKKASVPMLSVRIGDHCYYGLCDIGASISAIPYELYTEIMHEIGSCELEDIDVVIRLANRETISPIGIVRDVEVLCDCKKEKILTKFAGESYEFNFSKFAKTPYKADLPNNDFRVEQCASIALAPNNPLQQHLENSESEVFREERDELDEIFLRQPILKHDLPVEDLGTTPPPKEDPVFDLKPLPDNLKYAHIDDKKIYPVIISSKLSEFEEERY